MDNKEIRPEQILSVDKDAHINVTVNRSEDGAEVDLGRIFKAMKKRFRLYAWVLIICICVGILAPLMLYQFTRKPLTVSSVVTLDYDVISGGTSHHVSDLTAPDGSSLDLSQITSSYVLQNAITGLDLSAELTLTELRNNVKIERILTENSRRQQEIAAKMVADKNSGAYTQVQNVRITYMNQFIVYLTNGFKDKNGKVKYLNDNELRVVLDRILTAYNDYLVETYADVRLPDNEIAAIDVTSMDIMESLDSLRNAVNKLYNYCSSKPAEIRAYRSWKSGISLNDLMVILSSARDVDVEYLYSHVYANNIVRDRDAMITNYRYQLRDAETKLDLTNETIDTTKSILEKYINDTIYVSMEQSDTAKSTQVTTDYYNKLVLSQADNYRAAAELEIKIADLNDRISKLEASDPSEAEHADQELQNALRTCSSIYEDIREQMIEIFESPFYTTYAQRSSASGKSRSIVASCMKRMIVGAVAGIFLGCCIWFCDALISELRSKNKNDKGEEVSE